MSSLNCSLLVHTFKPYERYWDGFISGWRKHCYKETFGLYFGSDFSGQQKHDFWEFFVLYSGAGEWSDRLRNLLVQIPDDYVLYCQEDMWPCASLPPMRELMQIVQENDLYRLQISPIVQFYSLCGAKIPLFFHWKSKYLVSHQPSIWKKSFLLECLKPNENPWENEYEGTKRLNTEKITGKIAIYPHQWFTHECINPRKLE